MLSQNMDGSVSVFGRPAIVAGRLGQLLHFFIEPDQQGSACGQRGVVLMPVSRCVALLGILVLGRCDVHRLSIP